MNQGKTPKFNDIDAYKLFTIYDIIRILPTPIKVGTKTKFQISYWTKDYDSTSKLYMPANLEALINIINDVFEITNFSGLMANIKAKLLSIVPEYNKFKHLNLAPSHITNPRSQGCPRFQSGEELVNSVGKINACYLL